MRFTPIVIRSILGAIIAICAIVVLAISAHVEHDTRAVVGLKSSTFTFDAFVGAFTIVAEVAYLVLRLVKFQRLSLAAEAGLGGVLFIFWVAAGIDTTKYTEDGRSICKHLDDLFALPEFENQDPDAVALVKKLFKSACSELHAELAFLWIGFIAVTFALGYVVVLALRQKSRGNSGYWKTTLANYDVVDHSSADPFADPAGRTQGPVVGVMGEEGNPDYKP